MLSIYVTYHVKPGMRDTFYQGIQELGVRDCSMHEAGNLQYDYYFAAEDPDVLFLAERWTDPACQEAHTKTETFAKLQALKARCCTGTDLQKFQA